MRSVVMVMRVCVVAGALLAFGANADAATPNVRLAGDAPTAFAHGIRQVASSRLASRQQVTITVVLKRTDQAGFNRYLEAVYDRHSPQYRQLLTKAQLANRFGPGSPSTAGCRHD